MTSTDTARLPPAYWRLWGASTISNLGDGVFIVALPLLAARLTRSELSISFIGVATALPWLVLSLPIGAMVDRIDHRVLMVRADLFRCVVVGALTIAVATDRAEVWMLWLAAGFLGIAEVFFDNASQAMVPAIVPVEQLERANGRRFAAEIAANSFVGTLIVVAAADFHRVARITQADKVDAFDHAAGVDIEAGNNSFGEHGSGIL